MPCGDKEARSFWPVAYHSFPITRDVQRKLKEVQTRVHYLHGEDLLSKSIQTFHLIDVHELSL